MSKYIATRLHKARELAPEDEFFAECAALPHYVIDPSLAELLWRGDIQSSIAAMIEAGIAKLPFEKMLIEVETGSARTRSFIVLEESPNGFSARMGCLWGERAAESDPLRAKLTLDLEGINVEADERTHPTWARVMGVTLAIALLMLNIQGVEKETIHPTKLNKQRRARDAPTISSHTVLRIGHVYDREGRSHAAPTGRTLPVHLRAGHTRRQHFGENNSAIKVIYIPPVLVNFIPGGAPAALPKKIIAL